MGAQACDLNANEMPPTMSPDHGRRRGAGAAMFKNILLTVDLEHADTWNKALPLALASAKARRPGCMS